MQVKWSFILTQNRLLNVQCISVINSVLVKTNFYSACWLVVCMRCTWFICSSGLTHHQTTNNNSCAREKLEKSTVSPETRQVFLSIIPVNLARSHTQISLATCVCVWLMWMHYSVQVRGRMHLQITGALNSTVNENETHTQLRKRRKERKQEKWNEMKWVYLTRITFFIKSMRE